MTGDPRRLLEDPTTGAALRRDLGVARRGPAYDVEAGLARFEASLVTNLAQGTGAAGGGGSGGFAVGALLLAGGLAAALGWQLAGPVASPTTPTLVAHAADVRRPVATEKSAPVSATPEDGDDEIALDEVADDEVAALEPSVVEPLAAPITRKPRGARGPRNHASAVEPAGDYLREARDLNVARGLLTGDPGRALTLAEAGVAKFRAGTFAPEWEGVAVLALIELGRTDAARVRGEAFLRRYPSGTYAPRIRQALADRP